MRDDAASGFVLDMLGDAFFSNRDGAMSKSALDGKVLGIYFQGTSGPNAKLLKGLQLLYKKKGTPSATGKEVGGDGSLEVIFVAASSNQEEFSKAFREHPWLAIPFAHAQRRARLRDLFELNTESNALVLIDNRGLVREDGGRVVAGGTITRDGATLVELAYSCQLALDTREKKTKEFESDREVAAREKKKLDEYLKRLEPSTARVKRQATLLAALKPSERRELAQFTEEPELPEGAKKGLDAAADAVSDAVLAASAASFAAFACRSLSFEKAPPSASPHIALEFARRRSGKCVFFACELLRAAAVNGGVSL